MSEGDATTTEARWRNYQQLIWTQQQIHLQIQQQQQYQNQKMNIGDNSQSMQPLIPHHPGQELRPDNVSEKSVEEPPVKETSDPWENFDAHAAFLGPTLWDKRVPYDGQDFKLEYVDLEDFLTENGIPTDPMSNGNHNFAKNQHPPPPHRGGDHNQGQNNTSEIPSSMMAQTSTSGENQLHQSIAGPSRISNQHHDHNPLNSMNHHKQPSRSPSPTESISSGISQDMGSDISPDSSQAGGDLSIGSVPGHDFDPRTRCFTEDELKPQPMIKKSRKQFVPDEAKDGKYWARRRKNNMAAKRSRDARRMKENQIAMRACYLEKENMALKQEIERIQKENILLKEQLRCCRRDH